MPRRGATMMRLLTGLCAVAVVALVWIPAACGAPKRHHAHKHAKVSANQAKLARQAKSVQRQLNAAQKVAFTEQDGYDDLLAERAQLRGLIGNQFAAMYMHGTHTSVPAILGAGSLKAMVAAAQLTKLNTDYIRHLQHECDQLQNAAARLALERDAALQHAVKINLRLQRIQAKIGAIEQRRVARQRAKARKRAARKNPIAAELAGFNTSADPDARTGSPSALMLAAGVLGGSSTISASSIDVFLAEHGSPMTGSGAYFVYSGERWGIDPRLLVAISGAESNFGSITCGQHNAWGWDCPNHPANFSSWAEGIDDVAQGLRQNYANAGLTSVPAIHAKYAPNGAKNDPTGLNNNWTANVSKYLIELGGNPYAVASGPAQASGSPSVASMTS